MKAEDLIGRPVSFMNDGRPLVGKVIAAEAKEPFGKGKIPDFKVTIQGASGRQLTVSAVESYLQFLESKPT